MTIHTFKQRYFTGANYRCSPNFLLLSTDTDSIPLPADFTESSCESLSPQQFWPNHSLFPRKSQTPPSHHLITPQLPSPRNEVILAPGHMQDSTQALASLALLWGRAGTHGMDAALCLQRRKALALDSKSWHNKERMGDENPIPLPPPQPNKHLISNMRQQED